MHLREEVRVERYRRFRSDEQRWSLRIGFTCLWLLFYDTPKAAFNTIIISNETLRIKSLSYT